MSSNIEQQETHPLFPSGEWEGFYTYSANGGGEQCKMVFSLDFKDGTVSGRGSDNIGGFKWLGEYNTGQLWCRMIKQYARHIVYYDGHVDENGIWGTWTIPPLSKGGFHIWPKENIEEKEEEEVRENVNISYL